MNRKILINSAGSTIMMVMLAIAGLSASTYVALDQLNSSKKSVKSIQIKKNQELIEFKLMALMADRSICTENFGGFLPNATHNKLVRGSYIVFGVGRTYSSETIKITGISTSQVSATEYSLNFSYEKKLTGQSNVQKIDKKFRLTGELNSTTGRIDYCYLDDGGLIESAVEEAMAKICNGPGVVNGSNPGECKVLSFTNSISSTPLAQANLGHGVGGYSINSSTGEFEFQQKPLIVQKGTSDNECDFGLRYTDVDPTNSVGTGVFECFNLDDLIDEAPQTILEGSTCGIEMDATTKKHRLNCVGGNVANPGNPITPVGPIDSGSAQWEYGSWGACSNDLACKQTRSRTCKNSSTGATLPDSDCTSLPETTTRACPTPNTCPTSNPTTGAWTDILDIYCVEYNQGGNTSCYSLTKAECKDGSGNPVAHTNCGAKPAEATGKNLSVPPVGCNPTTSVACWTRSITCPTGASANACISNAP